MHCQNCGREIVEGQVFCRGCGTRTVPETSHEETVNVSEQQASVNEGQNVSAEISSADNNQGAQQGCSVQSTEHVVIDASCDNSQEVFDTPVFDDNILKPKKRKKAVKITILSLLLVLVIAGGVFAYMAGMEFFYKAFMSSEDYFTHVIDNNKEETASHWSRAYANTRRYFASGNAINVDINYTFSDEYMDLMTENMSFEEKMMIDWVNKMNLGMKLGYGSQDADISFKLGANDVDIASVEMALNTESESCYFAVPEVNPTSVRLTEVGIAEFGEGYKKVMALLDSLPQEEPVKKMIESYADILADKVDTVKETEETVTIEGMSQEYTLLTVSFENDSNKACMDALVSKTIDDENLVKVYEKIVDFTSYTGDDLTVDEIKNSIASMVKSIDEITIHVDNEGKIQGYTIVIEGNEFSCVVVEDDNDVATLVNIDLPVNGINVPVELSEKYTKSNGKLNGKGTISVLESPVLSVTFNNLDAEKLDSFMTDGQYIIQSEPGIGEVLELIDKSGFNIDDESKKKMANFRSEVTYSQSDINHYSSKVDTYLEGKLMMSMEESAEFINDYKSVPPTDFLDFSEEEKVVEWVSGMSLETLATNLENAGLGSMFVEAIRQADEELKEEYAQESEQEESVEDEESPSLEE